MAQIDLTDARTPSERRSSDRRKLIIEVRYEGGDATGIASTRDIGSGGLYMTTVAPLEQGTPIAMSLTLDARQMDLAGVVVYCDPGHGVGVRFRDMKEEDTAFLAEKLDLG